MKIVSYLSGIPVKNNNLQKPAILNNFIQGCNVVGDQGIPYVGFDMQECDVGVIQGFTHVDGKHLPHLQLRSKVIQHQISRGKHTVIADSNLFLYADPAQQHNYLRFSFDGVFPNTGFYFDKDIDAERWKKISKNLGIPLKDYRQQGNHILICLQRNGGWSMRGLPVMDWLRNTIQEIRKYSDRPIIVRGHPGDKKKEIYLKINEPNVHVSDFRRHITQDLDNAWATVTYNSSPGVASLIEGIPVFMTDPDPNYSQYSEVANHNFKRLEDPKMYNRQEWIEKISMCHWNFQELQSGEAWSFMRQYV
jgi:hypothetical protein|tara:strand:+ start:600 stop:1517 length:918 start_codon:yes stop_codon:yes gene_type:complete